MTEPLGAETTRLDLVQNSLLEQDEGQEIQRSNAESKETQSSETETLDSDCMYTTADEASFKDFVARLNASGIGEPRSSNALQHPDESINVPRSSNYWVQLGESVRNSRLSNQRVNRSSLIAPRSSDYIDSQGAQIRSSAQVSSEKYSLSNAAESDTDDQGPFPEPMNTPAYDAWMEERMNKETARRLQLEAIDLVNKIVSEALVRLPLVHDRAPEGWTLLRQHCSDALTQARHLQEVPGRSLLSGMERIRLWREGFLPRFTLVMVELDFIGKQPEFEREKHVQCLTLLQPLPAMCQRAKRQIPMVRNEIRSV
jgi:hypothetical protein